MNEDFAPFELAVKLKEKGFPQDVFIGYDEFGTLCIGDEHSIVCASPTISQVLKWLREEKKMHIQILFTCPPNKWEYITVKTINNELRGMCATFTSYEQAAVAGIEYVLDNLI